MAGSQHERSRRRAVVAAHDAIERLRIEAAVRDANLDVAASARNTREAVELVRFYDPDLVVVDAAVAGNEAVAVVGRMTYDRPDRLVILLTDEEHEQLALASLRGGGAGTLPRNLSTPALARAIAGVVRGEAALSRTLSMRLIEELREHGS